MIIIVAIGYGAIVIGCFLKKIHRNIEKMKMTKENIQKESREKEMNNEIELLKSKYVKPSDNEYEDEYLLPKESPRYLRPTETGYVSNHEIAKLKYILQRKNYTDCYIFVTWKTFEILIYRKTNIIHEGQNMLQSIDDSNSWVSENGQSIFNGKKPGYKEGNWQHMKTNMPWAATFDPITFEKATSKNKDKEEHRQVESNTWEKMLSPMTFNKKMN